MIQIHDFCTAERSVETVWQALSQLQSQQLSTELEQSGYNSERIREGFDLADSLRKRFHIMQGSFGENILAVTAQHKIMRTIKAMYECTRRVAEIAFSDLPAAQIALHLNNHGTNWYVEAQEFYAALNYNLHYSSRLHSWGYSTIRLREESDRLKRCPQISSNYPDLELNTEIYCDLEILSGWCENFIHSAERSLPQSELFSEFRKLYS